MKRITFRANADLIEEAREAARSQNTTLGEAFREWLAEFSSGEARISEIQPLMERLKYVNSGGRRFTRDELNER